MRFQVFRDKIYPSLPILAIGNTTQTLLEQLSQNKTSSVPRTGTAICILETLAQDLSSRNILYTNQAQTRTWRVRIHTTN